MKKISKLTIVLILSCVIFACSNPLKVHYDNIKLALLLNQDAEVTLEEVNQSEVDLALIKSGNRAVAKIAKAYSEFNKDKWISKDRAMLVIKDHRIIKTVGFKNDQLTILTGATDPLADIASIHNKTWQWQIDWEVGEYGYHIASSFHTDKDTIQLLNQSFEVLLITEQVIYADGSEWENYYWLDKESGLMLKTIQKNAPFADQFEISFVSNAARLMR